MMRSWTTRTSSAILVALGLVLALRSVAHAHATLIEASPAPGSVLAASPAMVRLRFDEPLDLSVSRVVLVDGRGRDVPVHLMLDPHDVHALVARLPTIGQGAYRVEWSTVSADGHAVAGSYVFRVGRGAAAAPAPPASRGSGAHPAGQVSLLVLLRAAGDLLVCCTAGLLFFGVLFGAWPATAPRARHVAAVAAAASPVVLAAHDFAWAIASAPRDAAAGEWLRAMFSTGQGHLELARLALAILVAWALLLMRREAIALVFSALLLCLTGAVGHPLAMSPGLAVPLKAAHCLAMAGWIGGLLWILLADSTAARRARFAADVGTISNVALGAVLVLAASGLGMAATFMSFDRATLLHSGYARLVALKVLGLVGLAGFGYVNRERHVPRLGPDDSGEALRHSVRYEVIVMVAVFAIGAWLSYTSPHG